MNPLVETRHVTKHFPMRGGKVVHAVDGVTLSIAERETVGLVGESGSGKSTFGKTILGLHDKTSGEVHFRSERLPHRYRPEDFRRLATRMQMVFQDPYSSLNPRMTVGEIVGEGLKLHSTLTRAQRNEKVADWLARVGLEPDHMSRYPHEFSGGQRQRIGIARALALNPKLIVCDEPVSALDVSVQAQVVNLLQDLQSEFGLTYLFISHGLAVVEHISNRVAVMYLGKIVEIAEAAELYANPLHPYTKALLSAIPIPDPKQKRERIVLTGDVPTPINPPSGCRFRTRCPWAIDDCAMVVPELREITPGHTAACIRVQGYDMAPIAE